MTRVVLLSAAAALAACASSHSPAAQPEGGARVLTLDAVASAAELRLHVHIDPRFHIQSNRPTQPYLVATRVAIDAPLGVHAGDAEFPPDAPYRVGDDLLRVFTGDFDVVVPLAIDASGEGVATTLRGRVRYQACTERGCLFPREESFEAALRLDGNRGKPP